MFHVELAAEVEATVLREVLVELGDRLGAFELWRVTVRPRRVVEVVLLRELGRAAIASLEDTGKWIDAVSLGDVLAHLGFA